MEEQERGKTDMGERVMRVRDEKDGEKLNGKPQIKKKV